MVCVSGACSPVFWIKKYRDMPDIGDTTDCKSGGRRTIREKNVDVENYYITRYGKRDERKFSTKPIEIDENRMVVRDETDGVVLPTGDTSHSGVKLTFVHLSDVQLRDEQVRLYDKVASKLADYIITSFERESCVEVFDGALYYAIVQTVNATVDSLPEDDLQRPAFMIHTGDAIDAGVVNELYEFLYISNEIKIPWYNVLGNHDVGTFGNIEQKMVYVNDPFVEFMTMHSKFNFINMHHNTYEDYPFVNVSPRNTDMDRTIVATSHLYSKFNGFDRLHYSHDEVRELYVCDRCPGYYSIEVKEKNQATGDPAIQMIVLDTGLNLGAYGSVADDQFKWLEREIKESKDKITLVFGHHNINSIENGRKLKKLFASDPSIIAYFCGHTHTHKINYHPGEGDGFGFWEVITGAIFAYPQQGSVVRIKYEEGIGMLDVYAFSHTIQETYGNEGSKQKSKLFEHVKSAYEGAKEDISAKKIKNIDTTVKDRYARLGFPYPRFK
jgi:3',5'-cyclic AMP phosphodiesterase CpdA